VLYASSSSSLPRRVDRVSSNAGGRTSEPPQTCSTASTSVPWAVWREPYRTRCIWTPDRMRHSWIDRLLGTVTPRSVWRLRADQPGTPAAASATSQPSYVSRPSQTGVIAAPRRRITPPAQVFQIGKARVGPAPFRGIGAIAELMLSPHALKKALTTDAMLWLSPT
jgi:hypothetical protein